jgi:hypothetical protein
MWLLLQNVAFGSGLGLGIWTCSSVRGLVRGSVGGWAEIGLGWNWELGRPTWTGT